RVAPGLEVERERARQPVGDVLLLAQDLRALLDLELGRLVAALVRDLERGRAGRGRQLGRRATVVRQRDRHLLAALGVVAAAARSKQEHGGGRRRYPRREDDHA